MKWWIAGGLWITVSCGDSPAGPQPVATRLEFSVQPSNAIAGAPISPQVRVLDASGNAFTSPIAVTLTLTASNGATLSGTTSASASSGVATFSNVRIEKAGTAYVLTASSASLTGATSNPFDVTHAAAAKLRFVAQPSPAAAGQAISPAVTVEITDQYDNRATSATNAVTVTPGTNETGLLVLGSATVAAVSGLATFSDISLNRSGSHTLTASSAGLTSATSATFLVQLASLARYCPADAGARASFGSIRDALNAIEPGGTIVICDGVHDMDHVVINRPVTIKPEHEGMVTITNAGTPYAFGVAAVPTGAVRFTGLTFDVSNTAGVAAYAFYEEVVVEGSTFRAVGTARNAVMVAAPSGTTSNAVVTVRGNTATGFTNAFEARVATRVNVLDNRIDASGERSIFHAGKSGIIQRNRITGCGTVACITASPGVEGPVDVLDNEIENDISRGTQDGLLLSGRVFAQRNKVIGLGGVGPQSAISPNDFAFTGGAIHISSAGEFFPVIQRNEIRNAYIGVLAAPLATQPNVRENRMTRLGWVFSFPTPGPIGVPIGQVERNDIADFGAILDAPAGSVTTMWFRCNWWGRAIGPIQVANQPMIPLSQWQPFSLTTIADRTDITCNPTAQPQPTRFCPAEFPAGTGWDDLAKAVAVTTPDNSIRVCNGVHPVSGVVIDRPLMIRGEDTRTATFTGGDGAMLIVSGPKGAYRFLELNFVVGNGVGILVQKNALDATKPGYGELDIRGNHFTMTGPLGRGVVIGPTDIPGTTALVQQNTFTGGRRGLEVNGAGPVEILENKFTGQKPTSNPEESASIRLISGGPYTVRKDTVYGCAEFCIQVQSANAVISDNLLVTDTATATLAGIYVTSSSATVSRNTINGGLAIASGGRLDPASYAFRWAGLLVSGETSSATVTGNSVQNARAGIQFSNSPVIGRDNTVTLVQWAVSGTTASPSIHRNDFTNYIEAMEVLGSIPNGSLTCNYWGSSTGPAPPPPNSGYYTPFSPVPIANKPEVTCP